MYSQYGEERVLRDFFGDKTEGFVVDVGAMDGQTYSNSRDLIENKGWKGVLVECHPQFFADLEKLYKGNDDIALKNVACYNEEKVLDFYMYSEGVHASVSTVSEEFKQRVINAHGDKFKPEAVQVQAVRLETILSECEKVDFLSIDCEGVDMEVLESNDWTKYRPSLVCVEHSMSHEELHQFMSKINYSVYDKTAGNTFFKQDI